MCKWQTARIGEVATIFDGPHATPKTVDHGPLYLGIDSLAQGRLELNDTRHVTEVDYRKWTRRVTPQAWDIVFSYETKIGEAAIVPEGLRCCLGRRMGLVRADQYKLDPRFFLYQYLSPEFQAFLRSRTVPGSTVDRILLTEFPDFKVHLPALDEQRAIASILGALDDKIELNRRMNENIEALARAIFKSWFVSLDIVSVSAEKLIHDKALLIGDGYRAKNEEMGELGLPFLRAANLKNGFDLLSADILSADSVMKAGGKRSAAGDVVFTSKGTIGRMARVAKTTPPFIYSPQVCFWRSLLHHRLQPVFLFLWMQSRGFLDQIEAVAGQTDMAPYVSLRDQRPMSVSLPSAEQQAKLSERVEPILDLAAENVMQNQTLAALRDLLLPKLMSGEVRVCAAEKALEVAM